MLSPFFRGSSAGRFFLKDKNRSADDPLKRKVQSWITIYSNLVKPPGSGTNTRLKGGKTLGRPGSENPPINSHYHIWYGAQTSRVWLPHTPRTASVLAWAIPPLEEGQGWPRPPWLEGGFLALKFFSPGVPPPGLALHMITYYGSGYISRSGSTPLSSTRSSH